MGYEYGNNPVEDYCRLREEQFNLITKSAYMGLVVITLFAIAICFA